MAARKELFWLASMLGTSVLGLALFGADTKEEQTAHAAAAADEGCPETSSPETHKGSTLQQFADESAGGIVYDEARSELALAKAAGLFKNTTLGITDKFNVAAAADYDNDGWTDLVVGSSSSTFLRFYRNETFNSPEPDWTDPSDIRTPNFVRTRDLVGDSGVASDAGMTAGDFDQDGNADFFFYQNIGSSRDNTTLEVQSIYLGKGNGDFQSPYNASSNVSDFGYFMWSSTNSVVYDWNKDGWPDIIFGTKLTSSNNSGAVRALINDCPDTWTSPTTKCSQKPKFVAQDILTGIDFGYRGVNALTMADFTGDGLIDLVIGSPSYCGRLRLYKGQSGGGIDTSTYDEIDNGSYSNGAATVMLAADFALNGRKDLVFGTDNWNCGSNLGGATYFHKNNLTATPFTGGADQRLTRNGQTIGGVYLQDFDLGVAIDYDKDPDGTKDFLIADGNDSGSFYIFANRVVSQYVDCGEVQSGVLDLGDLANEEMVVTSARIDPDMVLPSGTTATFYMSNESPANWQEASPCVDDATEYCVSFPKPVGREVRWKVEMCSDSTKTLTPSIDGVEIAFDYTEAEEHYRAGVVVDDGVAYVGAFRQPGDRGHFYAINAGLDTTYWDFATSLDAMNDSERNIYTATVDGKYRLDFDASNASSTQLQTTLGVASSTQASTLINWQRSARFGIGGVTAMSRLGAVETSTPAVVGPPALPTWYPRAGLSDREAIDAFITENEDRPKLVLFGSRDGALHAVYTTPTNIADTKNGTEAWAYIPPKVASAFASDIVSGDASAYPDGSPTVADVIFSDESVHTVAIVASGNGGKSVFALDISDTVDPSTGIVKGPTPLWHTVPGGANAGQAFSKPVIARVSDGSATRYLAIMATGRASDNLSAPYTKGRDVIAINIETGDTVWNVRSVCPVTSDIIIYETDDDLEPDEVAIDGYIDRAVWADACGNVYKVDPSQEPKGNDTFIEAYGSDTGYNDPDRNDINVLFSTVDTDCALGVERPIVGTIGGRTDASGRFTLFFGTGGIESFDPSLQNAFYAIYADTGEIRGCAEGAPEKGRIEGRCDGGTCEKFYGGVVVSASDVFVTRAIDAPVGTGTCEFGSSEVAGFSVSEFDEGFSVASTSATVSSLYGDAGAIYFATLSGDLVRIGSPRASNAGDDSAAGGIDDQANVDEDGNESAGEAVKILGWRYLQ